MQGPEGMGVTAASSFSWKHTDLGSPSQGGLNHPGPMRPVPGGTLPQSNTLHLQPFAGTE